MEYLVGEGFFGLFCLLMLEMFSVIEVIECYRVNKEFRVLYVCECRGMVSIF